MTGDVDDMLALFGGRPLPHVYDGLSASDRDGLGPVDLAFLIERKAAPPAGEIEAMLASTMVELKAALAVFRDRRRETATETGDEAARKLAQAEAKASIDAISLIVRTLEKIDSLQRTLMDDRRAETPDALDDAGYRALVDRIEALIDERADERAQLDRAADRGGMRGADPVPDVREQPG